MFLHLFISLGEFNLIRTLDDDLDDKADREIHDDSMSVASSSVASEQRLDSDLDVPPYEWSQLPAHHCAYCGIHSPHSVVKCLGKDCNKWFCNGNSTSPNSSSHIIMHLVKSRHKEIQVHDESELKKIAEIIMNLQVFGISSRNL